MNSTALFDGMAAGYDAAWTNTAIGRAQRNQVWREIDGLFHEGERILDVGCGTGEDAGHYAARGVSVCATDASPAMVAVAQTRGGFAAQVCRAEDLEKLDGTFDGAFDGVISNFGALNCVLDLTAVADSLAGLVRPGGTVAICLLGRWCAWETLYYAVRLQFGKAARRWTGHAWAGQASPITIWYPTTEEVRAAFAEGFRLRRWTGIGLLVPPSYVKLPAGFVAVLAACDRQLARVPLLRALADHRLFVLERR